ncbi:hypothetical protein RE6C_05809 [Rhodopirellula europaea 6C]|uniref:Uncharacterized protein n=1 Tax=Rhodopirellula europaea 6C TaxID=1263867 RepID=M2A3B4_9BACT|nr:hypothetical protein RE6C_05809 [Rhodopirellula europaea 6C]
MQQIYERLRDKNRHLPFIFVTKSQDGDGLAINPVQLYRFLLGNANVFAFYDDAVLAGMNYLLGDDFRVGEGSVRCFHRYFDKKHTGNQRWHRYFSPHQIEEQGEQWVIQAIANGFARNSDCLSARDIKSFNDIHSVRRSAQVKRLRQAIADRAASTNDEELNEMIIAYDELEKAMAEIESFANQLSKEKDAAEQAQAEMRYQIREAERLRQQYQDAATIQKTVDTFKELPKSLSEALQMAERLFPDKLAVTENAYKTATEFSQGSEYWRKQESVATAWNFLFCFANVLHELVFTEVAGDPSCQFKDSTGYDYAPTEGSMTKDDSKMMRKRSFTYKGTQFDMSPHLKLNKKKGEYLRLHFAIDQKKKRFIVNHFGEHIETAGTRRQS